MANAVREGCSTMAKRMLSKSRAFRLGAGSLMDFTGRGTYRTAAAATRRASVTGSYTKATAAGRGQLVGAKKR